MAPPSLREFWRNLWGAPPAPPAPVASADAVVPVVIATGSPGPVDPDATTSGDDGPAVRTASVGIARLRVGVVSTVGNYREHNEDNFYLPAPPGRSTSGGTDDRDDGVELPTKDAAPSLFVVADGMGGQLAGEKASQMAVDIIPKELSRRIVPAGRGPRIGRSARRFATSVAAANQEILGLSVVQTEFNNMGTTVVLALFHGDRVYVAGIGDSRAYRVRDGRIEQADQGPLAGPGLARRRHDHARGIT